MTTMCGVEGGRGGGAHEPAEEHHFAVVAAVKF